MYKLFLLLIFGETTINNNLVHLLWIATEMIIGLVGRERVGKDTFADILVAKYGFKKHSMADPIRDIAYMLFPHWQSPQINKDAVDLVSGIRPRDFMKWLGTDVFQLAFHQKFPDVAIPDRSIWSSICAQRITADSPDSNWVIPDIRFKHEAEQIAQLGGIFINLVNCASDDFTNSEQSSYDIPYILENYEYTKVVNNKEDGLAGLETQICDLLSYIK